MEPDEATYVYIRLGGEAPSGTWLYRSRRYSAKIDQEDEELVRSLGPWRVEGGERSPLRAYTDGPNPTNFWGRDSHGNFIKPWEGRMYLHELVMGKGAGEEVYALNYNLLDCRKANLRKRSSEAAEQERQRHAAFRNRREEERARQRQEEKERARALEWEAARACGFKTLKRYRYWLWLRDNYGPRAAGPPGEK